MWNEFMIGIVGYVPRMGKDTEDSYLIGEIIPIIYRFESYLICDPNEHYKQKEKFERDIFYIENTVKDLKVGDVIIFNLNREIIYRIKKYEGLGIRIEGIEIEDVPHSS